MELKIKNFGHGSGVEVRIIKVSADAVFENLNNQFQQMDDVGMEHGVNIAPAMVISCDGASTIAGNIAMGVESKKPRIDVYLNDRKIGTADDNTWVGGVFENASIPDDVSLSVYYLEEWRPIGVA